MSCDKTATYNAAVDALKLGDGKLLEKLFGFLGSDLFAKLLALFLKLGGGGGASVAATAANEKAMDASGVDFAAVQKALDDCKAA